MQLATIERIENINTQIKRAQHERPRTQEALKYVMECNSDILKENPYDDGRFSISLLRKCKQIVEHMPQTALALTQGYSAVNFQDAYDAIRTKRNLRT